MATKYSLYQAPLIPSSLNWKGGSSQSGGLLFCFSPWSAVGAEGIEHQTALSQAAFGETSKDAPWLARGHSVHCLLPPKVFTLSGVFYFCDCQATEQLCCLRLFTVAYRYLFAIWIPTSEILEEKKIRSFASISAVCPQRSLRYGSACTCTRERRDWDVRETSREMSRLRKSQHLDGSGTSTDSPKVCDVLFDHLSIRCMWSVF